MIEQARIDHIKTGVDLKTYIEQATGSAFKKNGKVLRAKILSYFVPNYRS